MERFGRYLLLEPLGKGGMGEVYLARRDGAERPCVLKLLRMEHRSNSSHSSRLKREAHLLSYLDHPHLARILDAGVEEGVFYLALEHIAGHTLRRIMKRYDQRGRPMPVGAALAIGVAVLDGLAYAHDLCDPDGKPLEIVHRDLSPNNIMVGRAGEVKIIDFGLASAKVDRFQTRPGVMLGTFRYAAPEQLDTGQVDKRSDLYTVAAVLYEAMTGRAVVTSRDPAEVLYEVMKAEPAPFREVAPDLPDALWEVIRAGLSKDPKNRPENGRVFAERLRRAAHVPIFSEELLGKTVSGMFSGQAVTALIRSAAPESISAETTASEASLVSGSASITKELPLAKSQPKPRTGTPWLVAALVALVVASLSFVAGHLLVREPSPIVIGAVEDPNTFERRVRGLLSEGRHREASNAMSIRAEDHLKTRQALEINRMLYDATTRGEWKSLGEILARQLEMEAVDARR